MAVWSIVKVSELEGAKRLDAEYYKPEYLRIQSLKKLPGDLLKNVAECFSGFAFPSEEFSSSGVLPVVKMTQILGDGFVDLLGSEYISADYYNKNKSACTKFAAKRYDVVVALTGATIGKSGVILEDALLNQRVLLCRAKRISKGQLWALLVSDIFKNFIVRGALGGSQPNVSPNYAISFYVPFIDHQIADEIENLTQQAIPLVESSRSLYMQAEQMVLKEVGWHKLDLSQPKWWAVPLSRAREVHRLDAEHFQPKYDKLIAHLKKTGRAKPLGEIAQFINHGPQPPYSDAHEIPIITQRHMGRYLLNFDSPEEFTTKAFWESKKRFQIQEKDVLFYSVGAYLGRTNLFLSGKPAMAGSYITIIRPNLKACLPEYLAVYLNAMPGQMQSDKHSRASGQQYIYPLDIAQFSIYLPSEKIQQQIADLVQQSYQARQKAKSLLEEAKAKVEALIEGTGA